MQGRHQGVCPECNCHVYIHVHCHTHNIMLTTRYDLFLECMHGNHSQSIWNTLPRIYLVHVCIGTCMYFMIIAQAFLPMHVHSGEGQELFVVVESQSVQTQLTII